MKLPDCHGACLSSPLALLSLSSQTVSGLSVASGGGGGASGQSETLKVGWDESPLSTRDPLHAGSETLGEPPSCEKHAHLAKLKDWAKRHKPQPKARL